MVIVYILQGALTSTPPEGTRRVTKDNVFPLLPPVASRKKGRRAQHPAGETAKSVTKGYIFPSPLIVAIENGLEGRGYVSESAIPYRRIGGEFSFFLN